MDYETIKALALTLGRSVETLVAMTTQNDPFYITPQRQASAKWFARIWHEQGFGPGTHVRRIHYRLVSLHRDANGYACDDGQPYLNTVRCQSRMINASRDARFLELVPNDHFDDRRNDEPIEYLNDLQLAATLALEEVSDILAFEPKLYRSLPAIPGFQFQPPSINQRYQIEQWCEKTTANDILIDLAQQYHLNVITGSGEISETRCYQLIQRALRWQRPVRILYISDFDPGGVSIPAACARKIEFLNRNLGLDIQLRQVALTHEQCVQYQLPRTPLKDSEMRGEHFEDRFGEGGTELDALEAIHPGELRRIIEREVLRYHDPDLDARVQEEADRFRERLDAVHDEIVERHADERDALVQEHQEIIRRCNAALARFRRPLEQIEARHRLLQARIVAELNAEAPDFDSIEWPEPAEGDEDDDPLFDSQRDYLDQIERYKAHQGKSTTERRPARVRERLNARARNQRAAARAVRP